MEGLAGRALVLVREVEGKAVLAAFDLVDAGVGARVLVVTGEPARQISNGVPVDAVISAIVHTDEIVAP